MSDRRPENPVKRHRSRLWATAKALIRTRLTAGLITILPIVVTVWLVKAVFVWLRDASLWVVHACLVSTWGHRVLEDWGVNEEDLAVRGLAALPTHVQWTIAVFSVLLTISVLYMVGLFTANLLGRRILAALEALLDRVPFVKTVYRTLKQILTVFTGEGTKGFQRVALVPFPNQITRSVGFITNTFHDAETGDELCSVFIATTPNPTTGFVFILKRADLIEVDWSVEDAIKIVMSGGILSPGYVTMLTGGTLPDSRQPEAAKPGSPPT